MPEYILKKPDKYLETTVESILFKDLVSKFQLRNPKILSDLLLLLSDRIGSTSSSLKLSNILEINKDTVLTYVNYLKKTFLVSELVNFSTSRNKEIYNPSKIYFEDLGIASKYASKINYGALMENAVFNHLKVQALDSLRTKLGYLHEGGREIDFVVSNKGEITLIESKFVDKLEEIDFEFLKKAIKDTKAQKVLYVTRTINCKKNVDNKEVVFIPLFEFLGKDFLT